ncbi:MAG: rhomboid family intramembrane serine protease [Planctomycetes bacterium]|nr:rhomboid family intramembrane serine protease [Planctomycetota bacterium]
MDPATEPTRRVWRVVPALFAVQAACALAVLAGQIAWDPSLSFWVVGDLDAVAASPWTLLTHGFLHRHYLEFLLGATVLLLAGPAVEEALGSLRFLLLYACSLAGVGLFHALLATAAPEVVGPLFSGSLGASAALLSAYLLLYPSERVANVPGPIAYLLCALALVGVVRYVGWEMAQGLEDRVAVARNDAYSGENISAAQRVDLLWSAEAQVALRPDLSSAPWGFPLGVLVLGLCTGLRRAERRLRIALGIRMLESEVHARARVEALLEKIASAGKQSLTREELRFLSRASKRYYQRKASTRLTAGPLPRRPVGDPSREA